MRSETNPAFALRCWLPRVKKAARRSGSVLWLMQSFCAPQWLLRQA
jgi:hypothetical protein